MLCCLFFLLQTFKWADVIWYWMFKTVKCKCYLFIYIIFQQSFISITSDSANAYFSAGHLRTSSRLFTQEALHDAHVVPNSNDSQSNNQQFQDSHHSTHDSLAPLFTISTAYTPTLSRSLPPLHQHSNWNVIFDFHPQQRINIVAVTPAMYVVCSL